MDAEVVPLDRRTRLSRSWNLLVVVVVGATFLLQLVLTFTQEAESLSTRLIRLFSFFTIQSNLLVLATAAVLLVHPLRDGTVWRVVRLDALVGITVTGVVYLTVLGPLDSPQGADAVTNAGFHYAAPLLGALGWLLFGPRPRITAATVGWSLLWPFAWVVYTLARGAVTDWYPYPFVDAGELGYPRTLLNCLGVTALVLVVAGLYAVADRVLPPAPQVSPPA